MKIIDRINWASPEVQMDLHRLYGEKDAQTGRRRYSGFREMMLDPPPLEEACSDSDVNNSAPGSASLSPPTSWVTVERLSCTSLPDEFPGAGDGDGEAPRSQINIDAKNESSKKKKCLSLSQA